MCRSEFVFLVNPCFTSKFVKINSKFVNFTSKFVIFFLFHKFTSKTVIYLKYKFTTTYAWTMNC